MAIKLQKRSPKTFGFLVKELWCLIIIIIIMIIIVIVTKFTFPKIFIRTNFSCIHDRYTLYFFFSSCVVFPTQNVQIFERSMFVKTMPLCALKDEVHSWPPSWYISAPEPLHTLKYRIKIALYCAEEGQLCNMSIHLYVTAVKCLSEIDSYNRVK